MNVKRNCETDWNRKNSFSQGNRPDPKAGKGFETEADCPPLRGKIIQNDGRVAERIGIEQCKIPNS